jgi:hypothetical protein
MSGSGENGHLARTSPDAQRPNNRWVRRLRSPRQRPRARSSDHYRERANGSFVEIAATQSNAVPNHFW